MKNYINFYWTLIFILFLFVELIRNIFTNINYYKPFILFFIFLIIFTIQIDKECKYKYTPINQIISKSIFLTCIYLYSEYTVKCIPIFDIYLNVIFILPTFSQFFKSIIAYLITLSINYLISSNENNNKKKECKLDFYNFKYSYLLIIVFFITINTYIDIFYNLNNNPLFIFKKKQLKIEDNYDDMLALNSLKNQPSKNLNTIVNNVTGSINRDSLKNDIVDSVKISTNIIKNNIVDSVKNIVTDTIKK